MSLSKYSILLFVPIVLIIYISLYYPGLYGKFQFDDFVNIIDNSKIHITTLSIENLKQAALSGHAGPTKRPISVVTFAINHYFSGLNPFVFKLTNVIIHLFNGIALFYFSLLLLREFFPNQSKINTFDFRLVAFLVAFSWLIHPINLTSVLYVVQRMTSLSSFFTILACIIYIIGRKKDLKLNHWQSSLFYSIICSSLLGLLGVFSKESAALLPAYLLLIEVFLFKFQSSSSIIRKILFIYFLISISLLLYFILPGIPVNEWEKNVYAFRDFTLIERLLTESRVLCLYLFMTIVPLNKTLGFYHDDVIVSTSLIQPVTTLSSILFLLFLLYCGFHFYKKKPLISFFIFWFFISHLLESTFIPLEIMHEHRNYLASFGIIFLIYFIILQKNKNLISRNLIILLLLTYIAHLGLTLFNRSKVWSNEILHASVEATNHPYSYRAQYELGAIYVTYYQKKRDNKLFKLANRQFDLSIKLATTQIDAYIGKIILLSLSKKNDSGFRQTLLISKLTNVIRNKYIPDNQIPAINALNQCIIIKQCKVDKKEYLLFINTLLNTSHLRKKGKAFIYIFLGDYFREYLKNIHSAINQYKSAIRLIPKDIQFHIRYIIALINIGRYAEAQKNLEIAKEKDKYHTYRDKINKIESKLKSILKKQNG